MQEKKALSLNSTSFHTDSTSKVYYGQIDTMRFINIGVIIWGHCLIGWDNYIATNKFDKLLKITVFQTGKIGTIVFFVMAGFLLRPKLEKHNFKSFFRERLSTICIPWLFFIAFFLLVSVCQQLNIKEIWIKKDFGQFISGTYALLNGIVLYTAYWFITTYIITMLLFVFLRKYAERIWLGILLGMITLMYGINYYHGWIAVNHTKAILAYAVFVWIGIQVHKYFDQVQFMVQRIPWTILAPTLLVLFMLSGMEANLLSEIGCADPYGSNRISNSLFSLIFFIALLKVGEIKRINKLNPRGTVFGIFLIHNLVIYEFSAVVKSYVSPEWFNNIWNLLFLQFFFLLLVMILTYKLVELLGKSNYKWLIGIHPKS